MLRNLFWLVVTSFFVASCVNGQGGSALNEAESQTGAGVPASAEEDAKLKVVATSNIVGDWVRQVGGNRVEVFDLMPIGADPHTFQPGARDITQIADADIIFSVGLNLEGAWLKELLDNASADPGKVLVLGDSVNPIEFAEPHDEHEEEEHDTHGELDPHFWFDPTRVKLVVTDIGSSLSAVDAEGAETYQANARAYNERLDGLHEWIKGQVAEVPVERRLLVTSHESLGYFAEAYGFQVIGTVIGGGSTELEPSAQVMTELIEEIRESNVSAIFAETSLNDRLSNRIAEEAGVNVVSGLHTGSLGGRESGAENYIDFMRLNVGIIVKALK